MSIHSKCSDLYFNNSTQVVIINSDWQNQINELKFHSVRRYKNQNRLIFNTDNTSRQSNPY